MLTIQAATERSGQALFLALSRFQPHWATDAQGRYFVTVMLGGDERVLEVLDAIQQHCAERTDKGPMKMALDGRQYLLEA